MTRIAWLSRHQPLPAQIEALKSVFGTVEVVQESNTWTDADAIMKCIQGFDEVVIVAPLSLIDQLIRRGVKPIRAVMQLQPAGTPVDPRTDVVEKDRHYRFVKFERIVRLTVETVDL